jgi:hypothetical protein
MKFQYILALALSFGLSACLNLDSVEDLNPDGGAVISNGGDLQDVLDVAYANWWQGVHSNHPAIALSVSADAFTFSLDGFGAAQMSDEPRQVYNNSISEPADYRAIVEVPWYGCLSAVALANDVLIAMDEGISIDKNGPADQSVRAAAHMLRGLSWGYLGLLYDEVLLVDESTPLDGKLTFSPYTQAINAAVSELDLALALATSANIDFIHSSFNGLVLNDQQFIALCHSYSARFLTQWPRTPEEMLQVDWNLVLEHAEQGINEHFAPLANGRQWSSYHRYVFADAGEGPFWARVDQRLIAALDPSQPARYPEVEALGEPPLANTEAFSTDARLLDYFLYTPFNIFPVERGEWHFSHYQYNRNITDPTFAGNGMEGPMPAFRVEDKELLIAEALLNLSRRAEAIDMINNGSRVEQGNLAPLPTTANAADIAQAIIYERAIELLGTAPMGFWLDRRRWAPREDFQDMTPLGGLQTGTPAQLPVPEQELRINGLPPYSFGGPTDPLGIERVF